MNDASIIIPGGMNGNDLATSISLLTEYLGEFYSAGRRNTNVVLNSLVRGFESNDSSRPRPSAGTAIARPENLHPLLRRPSRTIPVQAATSGQNRPSEHETVNVVFGPGSGHSPFDSQAFLETMNFGSFGQRSRVGNFQILTIGL